MNPKNLVGPLVRKLRHAEGLSQEKFAARCQLTGWDITREGIAKIEGRVRHVDDQELVHLCRALRVRPDILLGYSERRGKGGF